MKKAAIIARGEIKRKGLDSLLVGTIHDEGQHDAATNDAEEVGKTCVAAIRSAGTTLGFKVPLDGAYSVGANWADTH